MQRLDLNTLDIKKQNDSYKVTSLLNGLSVELCENGLEFLNVISVNNKKEDILNKLNMEEDDFFSIVKQLQFNGIIPGAKEIREVTVKKGSPEFFNTLNMNSKVALLGVPYDGASTGAPGSRMGVSLLRESSKKFTRDVNDQGDLVVYPGESFSTISNKIKNIETEQKMIAIGGDHSITLPFLEKIEDDFVLVKIDAHFDSFKSVPGRPVSHTSFVSDAKKSLPNLEKVIHIGVRENVHPAMDNEGDVIIGRDEIAQRLLELNSILTGKNVYLTVDIDGFDPDIAPGTSFHISKGLSEKDFDLILAALDGANVIGGDLVEFNPLLDSNKKTLNLCMNILNKMIDHMEESK